MTRIVVLLGTLLVAGPAMAQSAAGQSSGVTLPELPRVRVDTTLVPPTGQTVLVPAGGNAQAAINAANPGDVVMLATTGTWQNLTLPAGKCTGVYKTLMSADPGIPKPGNRVTPADLPRLAKVRGTTDLSSGPALTALSGSCYWRIIGIEFAPTAEAHTPFDMVMLGTTETRVEDVPHHIILDRVIVRGSLTNGGKRGVVPHGAHQAVIDSYIYSWGMDGIDAQAICGWNGPGPFKFQNNYLEAAAENLNFGGARPTITGLIGADYEIVGNYVYKPLAWKTRQPPFLVKNMYEFKAGRRILIQGNVFENLWPHGQEGFVNMLSPRADSGEWAIVEDLTFRLNHVINSPGFVALSGADVTTPCCGQRFLWEHNLVEGLQRGGRAILIVNGAGHVTFRRNTIRAADPANYGAFLVTDHTSRNNNNLTMTGNVIGHGYYGISPNAKQGLDTWFRPWVVSGNVFYGPEAPALASIMPANNLYPAREPAQLPAGVGADLTALQAATACVRSGQCRP